MKRAKSLLQRFVFTPAHVPLALLVANVLAFGLLIPYLGYYQDDWHFVYYAYTRGTQGLWELFNYDGHPLSAWVYVIGFQLLGFKPIYWQMASLLWRFLATLAFWQCITELWPQQKKSTFVAALIFAVYPIFSLQPQAISYIEVWMSYALLNFSFYFTVKAARHPEKFLRFALLAFGLKSIHLFTTEYFAGLELIRPALIYLALRESRRENNRRLIWDTLGQWSPYILASGALIVWRTFFYLSPFAKQNAPILVMNLISSPLETFSHLVLSFIPDLVLLLTSPWTNVFKPELFDFATRLNFLFFCAAAGTGLIAWFVQHRMQQEAGEVPDKWPPQALMLGGLALGLGMLPAYAANYFIYTENPPWGSRFSIPAMFGASLITVAIINLFISSGRARNMLIAAFLGLSVNWHLNNANAFRLVWQKETRFFQQLIWRAPGIQPGTAIITEQEILSFMGDYPMAFAINSVYAERMVSTGRSIPYWYFSLTGNFGDKLDDFLKGMSIGARKFSVRFTGESTKNLILTFEPEQGQCLWLVRPEDGQNPAFSPLLQETSKFSAPEKITVQPKSQLVDIIFGGGSVDTWCRYYEEAQLARDSGDWKKVLQVLETANHAGLGPDSDFEYMLFMEAYAQTGNWKAAGDLAGRININQRLIRPSLCAMWTRIELETSVVSERDDLIRQQRTRLNCGN